MNLPEKVRQVTDHYLALADEVLGCCRLTLDESVSFRQS